MNIYHLCILDDDPAALITPVLDRNIPSDGVILSYPAHLSSLAARIQGLIKCHAADCHLVEYPSNASVEALKLHYTELYDRWFAHWANNNSDAALWLNASTGAHRPLLSALEVARLYQQKTFLVDPHTDRFVWLSPDSQPAEPIADKIKLNSFFQLYGAEVICASHQAGIPRAIRQLGEKWAMQVESHAQALGALNYLAATACTDPNLSSRPLSREQQNDAMLQQIIDDLLELDLVQYHNSQLTFADESARFFANGGWLEELTFSLVRGLRSQIHSIQDDGHSVAIQRTLQQGKAVKNELDVAFLANNKLHIIECKTMRFKGETAANTLYKLDSLSDLLGGMSARGMLVSYLPLRPADMQRAKDLQIEVVSYRELTQLKQKLSQWIARA